MTARRPRVLGALRPRNLHRAPAGGLPQALLLRAFVAVLAAGAVLLWLGPVQGSEPLHGLSGIPAPFHIPWALLAGAFFLAEIAVVHYDYRTEAHSFSLSELPLVFGLFFAAPSELVTAQVVGAALALVMHRRQVGLKLVFNLAHFALGAGLAVVVFQVVRDSPQILGSESWPAALLAAVASSAMSTVAIFCAISLSEGRARLQDLGEELALALLATIGAASLALLGAEATARHRLAVVLLAAPIGMFLLSYRAYVRQRQEHDSLEFLYDTARVLDGAPDLRSGMSEMLRASCRAFRSEVAQFVLFDNEGTALLVSATGEQACSAAYVDAGSVDPLLQRGLHLDEPRLLTLEPPMPGPDGHVLREVMVGAVGAGTKTPGAILIGNRTGTASFSSAQLHLFRTMIAHNDVSLANGRLARMLGEATTYAERERTNSLELQRGLLPARLPVREDVSVAVRYQPSGQGAEVGGDWYDVLVLPSGALGVVIGDVIGHDLKSAARMAQARSALRAYATEGHGPAAVMERLNRLLAEADPDFMGTCCYAEVMPQESRMTLVLAGHPPPLIVPSAGAPLLVDAEPGLPLGVDDQATYCATTLPLPAGAAFALYTDGLVETRQQSLAEGLERILRTPGLTGTADVEDIADRLLRLVDEGPASDDVALLVLRVLPTVSVGRVPAACAVPPIGMAAGARAVAGTPGG